MKRIGPLSLDLVVACAIHHLNITGREARWPELCNVLKGKMNQSEIPALLTSLMDWGIVRTEYTTLESGRSGRVYYLSDESAGLMKGLYDRFWERVMK